MEGMEGKRTISRAWPQGDGIQVVNSRSSRLPQLLQNRKTVCQVSRRLDSARRGPAPTRRCKRNPTNIHIAINEHPRVTAQSLLCVCCLISLSVTHVHGTFPACCPAPPEQTCHYYYIYTYIPVLYRSRPYSSAYHFLPQISHHAHP
ncbi:uncharacterized protein Ecym_4267 [Eremothecium cymbalariae DBVPG|uniref:Uncharacterized protein n=1 Tax=Eremothecium cymbalariae (strain CBS 270.75 / DBVPG 7215 / KCTC 17166 / NRRL Y-17582) TaxID=931890 RepID=G8JTH8_ERECY|nr:hypothetical protein Ecym_4267 [Eremothecium cymbalariae DBVPG\